MRNALITAVLIPFLLLTSGACMFRGPGDLRRDLSREADVELDRQFGMRLGRISTSIARLAMKTGDDDVSLRGLRRIEVGVYEVVSGGDAVIEPPNLEGWDTFVRIREPGESVYVMGRYRDEKLRNIVVVVAEEDEWVLVRLTGKLDRMLRDAMELAFEEADREELFEPAWAEYDRSRGVTDRELAES